MIKSKKKRQFSAAEKRAFKLGMSTQYNREHPKIKYEVVTCHTTYNSDGSVCSKHDGLSIACKNRTSAYELVRSKNRQEKFRNQRVLSAVRAKKVNEFNSYDCTTEISRVVKVNRRAKSGERIYR